MPGAPQIPIASIIQTYETIIQQQGEMITELNKRAMLAEMQVRQLVEQLAAAAEDLPADTETDKEV